MKKEHIAAAERLSAAVDAEAMIGYDGIEVFAIALAAYIHGLSTEPRQRRTVARIVAQKVEAVITLIEQKGTMQ